MSFQACQIHPRTSVRPSEPRFRGRDTAYDIRRVEHGLQVFEREQTQCHHFVSSAACRRNFPGFLPASCGDRAPGGVTDRDTRASHVLLAPHVLLQL
jgi:hypothetical protein